MAEHHSCKVEVVGSTPTTGSKKDDMKKSKKKVVYWVGGNEPLPRKMREHLEKVHRDSEEQLRKTSNISFVG